MKQVYKTFLLMLSIPFVLPMCILWHTVAGVFRGVYTYCYDFNNTDIGDWKVTHPNDRIV